MTGSPQQSCAFLRRVYPNDPVVLTAIDPDGKGIETRTFATDKDADMVKWLTKWGGKRNLYWGVNPPIVAMSKKCERENIRVMAMLHIDLDPRVGEDLEEERKRILGSLQNPPTGVLPPSIILYSGGGYQAFWLLRKPVEINGDIQLADQAAAYNIQLGVLLGGDNTQDVSRIMRIPYTLNIPGEKKKKKGRSIVMADVVEYHEDRVYDIEQFVPAVVASAHEVAKTKAAIDTANVARINDVNELDEWKVPDYVKVLIVQGKDIDNPDKYPSRSEAVWAVVCALVRCGVPDETVFSILTDPDLLISESILEKGPTRFETYALKQINDAKEEAIDPMLRKLNSKHAVIKHVGGDTCVVTELYSPVLDRYFVSRQSFAAFERACLSDPPIVMVDEDGRPKKVPVGKWWLRHPQCRKYELMSFAPGRDLPDVYNLWKGFKYNPKPGDCSLFLAHVRDNVCSGNEEYFTYLMGWMARAVQKPGAPGEVAVVLRGEQGTGKSFFATRFGGLFGRHFLKVSQPSHIVGNFNGHMQDVVILFADEGFYAGDKKHASVLKDLITGETLTIEHKGYTPEEQPNFLHIIIASNSDWIVPAGANERRYFVLDVGAAKMQNTGYFKKLEEQMSNGGYEALLHTLMSYDLSGYNVRNVPQTDALNEQKDMSMGYEESWWLNRLTDGRILDTDASWTGSAPRKDLYDSYLRFINDQRFGRPLTPIAFGVKLKKLLPAGWPKMVQQRQKGKHSPVRLYLVPPLDVCRDHFNKMDRRSRVWDTEDETVTTQETAPF